MSKPTSTSTPGAHALARLRAGNQRFVSGATELPARLEEQRPADFAAGQQPFAVVLGCSDSRVPVEIVFDQALGDLFVVRVAGNVVDPILLGSIEFAVEQFGAGLVVVLGHTDCGAIKATLSSLRAPAAERDDSIGAIVECIRPAVQDLMADTQDADAAALVSDAVRANVRASVESLRRDSPLLGTRIESGNLLVVGAEYSLETGLVEFFDGAHAGGDA